MSFRSERSWLVNCCPQLSEHQPASSKWVLAAYSRVLQMVYVLQLLLLLSLDTISSAGENQIVDGVNLDEMREFAKQFKIRRLSLGLTQTQVGQALSATEGPSYSQSAICRYVIFKVPSDYLWKM